MTIENNTPNTIELMVSVENKWESANFDLKKTHFYSFYIILFCVVFYNRLQKSPK